MRIQKAAFEAACFIAQRQMGQGEEGNASALIPMPHQYRPSPARFCSSPGSFSYRPGSHSDTKNLWTAGAEN
jgi:hypothetical protein